MKNTLFSLINYVGHKGKIVDQLLDYMPAQIDGTFYDIFAGSCVVGLSTPATIKQVTFVDKNPLLMELYSSLSHPGFQDTLEEIIKEYSLTNSFRKPRASYLEEENVGTVTWHGEVVKNFHLDQLNKPGYDKLLSDFNAGAFVSVRRGAAYMIAAIYGRNSNVNVKMRDGVPALEGGVGPLDFSLRCQKKLQEHISVIGQKNCRFNTADFRKISPTSSDFVYLDPPYLASGFKYGGWTPEDERDLLRWIDGLPCPWALSNTLSSGGVKNSILRDWAQDKNVIKIDKKYRKWAKRGTSLAGTETKENEEILVVSNILNSKNENGVNHGKL
jgi:DNA adenine methylase